MKILYDHQTFSGTKYGGVARYFYDLIRTIQHEPNVGVELALKFSNTQYLQDNSLGEYTSFQPLPIIGDTYTNAVFSHTNRSYSAYRILSKNYDIFHPTFFQDYFLPFLGKKPFVLTYHDVIPEKFPEYARLDGFTHSHKQNLLNKATKIIAVSENTKQDLLELFKISADKIEVVHHSTHFSSYKPSANFHISTPKNYLLYVGTRDNYKNFTNFLKDIAPLLKKHTDLKLICAGSFPFNLAETQLLKELTIDNQVKHVAIESDDMFYRLYENATAFIYPSLYEGFGIPILEAFACGCPVILSNRSSFPEVGQDAALYFNPDDGENMRNELEKLLSNESLRKELIQKGYNRLKDFSPEKTANKTLEVYKSIIY